MLSACHAHLLFRINHGVKLKLENACVFKFNIFLSTRSNATKCPLKLIICCIPCVHVLQYHTIPFHVYVSTVGSRLSELQLFVSEHLDIGSRCHVFGSSGKKMLRSLQFCYRRKQSCCMDDFSRMLQRLFHPVRDLDHDLQCPR